jgi:hypothetical protein
MISVSSIGLAVCAMCMIIVRGEEGKKGRDEKKMNEEDTNKQI